MRASDEGRYGEGRAGSDQRRCSQSRRRVHERYGSARSSRRRCGKSDSVLVNARVQARSNRDRCKSTNSWRGLIDHLADGADVAPVKFESPLYTAVIECVQR